MESTIQDQNDPDNFSNEGKISTENKKNNNIDKTSVKKDDSGKSKVMPLKNSKFNTNQINEDDWILVNVPFGEGYLLASLYGTMVLTPHKLVQINITVDQAVWITNALGNYSIAVNNDRKQFSFYHRTTSLMINNDLVELILCSNNGNHKFAKMSPGVVYFSSSKSPLCFHVDKTTIKTTARKCFRTILDDPKSVFFKGSCHGEVFIPECLSILEKGTYFPKQRNEWIFNGFQIINTNCGLKIYWKNHEYHVKIFDDGFITVKTPFWIFKLSLSTRDLYISRNMHIILCTKKTFQVKVGSKSAGFDELGKFTVF